MQNSNFRSHITTISIFELDDEQLDFSRFDNRTTSREKIQEFNKTIQ